MFEKMKTKKSIKLIVIAMLLMLCVIAFTACGGESGGSGDSSDSSNSSDSGDSFDTRPKLTLTTNIEGAGTVVGGGHFDYKEELFIKAEVNNGYHFLGWYYNDELLSTDAEYYCTMLWNKNITIEAQFTSTCRYKYNPENDLCVCELCGNSCTASELADDNGFVISSENELIAYVRDNSVVVIPDSVTRIGNSVFKGRANLTSVTIPNSVTSIGSYAFSGCTSLTSVTIPDKVRGIGIYAFENCRSLEEIYFNATEMLDSRPDDMGLFDYAGRDGNGIELIIGANVTKIPAYLFSYSDDLIFSSDSPKIISVEFEEGSVCKSIGSHAFYNCLTIKNVTIPDSVEIIGESAFAFCRNIENITLPFVGDSKDGTGNTHFGYIFGAASSTKNKSCVPLSLKNVVITGGKIDEFAFYECLYFTSLTIGNGVTSIDKGAFSWCDKLNSITLPFVGENKYGIRNTHFGFVFGASDCLSNKNYVPSSLKSVTITGGNIDELAFNECSSLTSVTIGSNVDKIGYEAFIDCTSLSELIIENGVTSIDSYAFNNCTRLRSATFKGTTTQWNSISKGKFWKSGTNITKVYCSDGSVSA